MSVPLALLPYQVPRSHVQEASRDTISPAVLCPDSSTSRSGCFSCARLLTDPMWVDLPACLCWRPWTRLFLFWETSMDVKCSFSGDDLLGGATADTAYWGRAKTPPGSGWSEGEAPHAETGAI